MALVGAHGTIYGLAKAYSTLTRKHRLGAYIFVDAGSSIGFHVFARANGAIAAGALCKIDTATWDADEVDTTESAALATVIGIPQVALADNEYGWFWRGVGTTEALLANGVSAGVSGTTTATAGVIGTGGDTIASLTMVDANATGSAARLTVHAYSFIGTN